MRKIREILVVAAAVTAAGLASTAVASADDGHVYAKATSVAGTESGGSAHADLHFTGRQTLTYNNFVVNDTCPGDNYDVHGRAIAIYMDGTSGYGTWHRDDEPTCDGAGWGPVSGLGFNGSKNIKKAGVEVCVMRPNATDICKTDFRLNPYTS